jgi:hypothetical protein
MTVEGCPQDLVVIQLLREFPGYTRRTLLQEPAPFIRRALRYLHKEHLYRKQEARG